MSSWLSGEERGLQSEGAQVRIKAEAEREEVMRREEIEGRTDCIVQVKGKKKFFHKFIAGIPKAIFCIL